MKAPDKNPELYIETEGEAPKKARQVTGIGQGCPLSPLMSALVVDRIVVVTMNGAGKRMKKGEIEAREAIGTEQGLTKIPPGIAIRKRHPTLQKLQKQKHRPCYGQ